MNKYFNGVLVETNGVRSLGGGGTNSSVGILNNSSAVINTSSISSTFYGNGSALTETLSSISSVYANSTLNLSLASFFKITIDGQSVIKFINPPTSSNYFSFRVQTVGNGFQPITTWPTAAQFNYPRCLVVSNGNFYITDAGNNTIRKMVLSTGEVTTFAGVGLLTGTTDGNGSSARFNNPSGITVDSNGNLYVVDRNNHAIRKITSSGDVTTFAGLAGTSGSQDGTGTSARFYNPSDICIDSSGNFYVTDSNNYTIRKITSAGVVTTFAGLAGTYGTTDGTGASARFRNIHQITADYNNNLYLTDNYAIRKITPAAVVTTIAGSMNTSGQIDATGLSARFGSPYGIVAASDGNLYICDPGGSTIRKMVLSSGNVTTIAGISNTNGTTDGIGTSALFNYPFGITIDSSNNLYIVDQGVHNIRKITLSSGTVSTISGVALKSGKTDGSLIQVIWLEGSPPALTFTAGKIDCFSFYTIYGIIYYGKVEGQLLNS